MARMVVRHAGARKSNLSKRAVATAQPMWVGDRRGASSVITAAPGSG
jgi:hypothetical protein